MAAMYRLRSLQMCVAALLLSACAAHRTTHVPAPVEAPIATKPAVPTARPPGKSQAEKNHANPNADKSVALPPREVGYYLDVLQGRLQQRLDPATTIGRERGSIVLDLSRRFSFAPDNAQLGDADRALLLPLARVLDEYRAVLVSVRVSADGNGVTADKLAQQRANGILRVLTDFGVAANRMVVVTPSAAPRDGNTRVEIALAPETRGD